MRRVNNIIKYLLIAAVVISLSSCASSIRRKVSLDGYENVDIMGFSGVKADLVFTNKSGHNIHLKTVTATVKEGGKDIATLELKDEIVIPRRCEGELVPTIWKLTDVNMLSALSASKKVLNHEGLDSFRVDLGAEVRISVVKRKLQYNDVSLKSLIDKL